MKKSHWSKEVACLALAKQAEQTPLTSSEDKPQELTRQNTHELLQVGITTLALYLLLSESWFSGRLLHKVYL